MNFYTYMWLREDGTPYYVGKGQGRRAYYRWQRSVPFPPKERILVEEHASEADAFEAERFLISFYGRKDLGLGPLLNFSDGGVGGTSGAIVSDETREKLSKFQRARKRKRGYHWSPEEKEKRRIALLGRPWTEERWLAAKRKTWTQWNTGKKASPEHKARMSIGIKAGWARRKAEMANVARQSA